MRRLLLVSLLVPLLACAGLLGPPRISSLDVVDGGCGTWSATVRVENAHGDTVRLRRGTEVLGTWPDVWGSQTIQADGAADGSRPVDLFAEIEGGDAEVATYEPDHPAFTVVSKRPSFPPGVSPQFELRVDQGCDPGSLRYEAATEWWSGEGRVAGATTAITVPPQDEGAHVLQVEVLRDRGSLGIVTVPFAVGDARVLDLDGDGYDGDVDCDDSDPQVNPMAPERSEPNDKDDNCDGRVDEGTVAYDDDGDGLSERKGDCNDADDLVHPGADERSNCRDDDCDGQVDEGRTLPRDDDRYERPGGEPFAFLDGGRRFDRNLVFVSRDRDDAEAVRFWSDDGDFDDWGIDVVAARVPADSEYDVEVRRADGGVVERGTLRADGDVVAVRGKAFRDDSGNYEVVLRPTRLYAPYCPIEISLHSR